jgi:deoxyribonuclease II
MKITTSTTSLSCIDNHHNPVDFWTIFKFPTSYNYTFLTSNTIGDNLEYPTSHNANLSTNNNLLANTVTQLWKYRNQNFSIDYVIWNDEDSIISVENSDDRISNDDTIPLEKYGHSKGILAIDNTTGDGFYIIHSAPRYPTPPISSPEKYSGLPSNTWEYGQNFACFSMRGYVWNTIGQQLQLIRPHITDYKLSTFSHQNYPDLIAAIINGKYTTNPVYNVVLISSARFMELDFFAKTSQWNQDIWTNAIAQFYQSNVEVESWLHGNDPIGPTTTCNTTSFGAVDVKYIYFNHNYQFENWHDHSKWGITTFKPIVCSSDINRMQSQKIRGGSSICFKNMRLWRILYKAIKDTDSCHNNKLK